MMGVIWNKVWRDLVHNKARTMLTVLSTAVGVFALGLVFGLSGVLHTRIMESHQGTIPAHITFWGGPFSPDIVDAIRREPGVADTEGETVTSFRWKMAGEEEWRNADLVARAEYGAQRMNLLRLQNGRWPDDRTSRPPTKHMLGMERLSSRYFGIPIGTSILVEVGQRERVVPVEGIVRAPVVVPPEWGGDAMFFATPETAAWLADYEYGEDFNRLNVLLESYSHEAAQEAAERIKDRLERIGSSVAGYQINDPNQHWVQDIVDAVMIILMVMGILSLGLSAFLIVNTMNAIIAQQMWQIGVMKAIGATFGRMALVYLAIALIYGGLALLLAVPLDVVGVHMVTTWLLDMLNVEAGTFQVEPAALGIQIAMGLTMPVLAALIPVLGGTRTTVREAISTYGIGSGFGHSWLDRLIGQIRSLPRLMTLSLRNVFRRKARVALTLATLTLSGAVFTMVLSTSASFNSTIANNFSLGEDVAIELDRPRRISRIIEIAESRPGVTRVEVWNQQDATLLLTAGPERNRQNSEEHAVRLTGVPPDSAIFKPNIVSGRSLRPDDGNALVFTLRLAEKEGIQVGDEVTLRIRDDESTWTVVGLYLSVDNVSDNFFVPLDVLGRETGTFGRGESVRVLSENDGLESQQQLIQTLSDTFAAQRIEVVDAWSVSKQMEESQASFGILTSLLLTMVILTAVVGSIGLMSTMSINVVERKREIGVMRSIGASSLAIAGIFAVEGVLVGTLSWLLAVPLSYPGAHVFSNLVGQSVLEMPLDFVYSAGGMMLWLLIVAVLSALASLWPALRAAQLSVREALAYE
jgi:putative ABC transport system permease protein